MMQVLLCIMFCTYTSLQQSCMPDVFCVRMLFHMTSEKTIILLQAGKLAGVADYKEHIICLLRQWRSEAFKLGTSPWLSSRCRNNQTALEDAFMCRWAAADFLL